MKLSINGEIREANFTTLEQWANAEFASDVKGIALAVNNSVAPKSKWDSFLLKEGDSILVVQATQGG